jgi:hypothetical protein
MFTSVSTLYHRRVAKAILPGLSAPNRDASRHLVVTLGQGSGPLIRSLEDRGVLVLLDPGVRRQGQTFLQSLPPYRVTQTITDVEAFFERDLNS